MVELKLNVEESLVKTLGQKSLERQLQIFLQHLLIKMSARDILSDLNKFDLTNDPKWEMARELAWESEKEKYLLSIQ